MSDEKVEPWMRELAIDISREQRGSPLTQTGLLDVIARHAPDQSEALRVAKEALKRAQGQYRMQYSSNTKELINLVTPYDSALAIIEQAQAKNRSSETAK